MYFDMPFGKCAHEIGGVYVGVFMRCRGGFPLTIKVLESLSASVCGKCSYLVIFVWSDVWAMGLQPLFIFK